ncbi:MAG: type II toxin-antitoxin system MqsR family toxin [Flavobacteriaceae bacterium]|nr:type II toxin-antitoxin system MqsR family toxin [Flavobacteriaceae bacterium]
MIHVKIPELIMQATKEEVKIFLQEFIVKVDCIGIVILRERTENLQTILDLELTNVTIREQLKKLTFKDFYKGPTEDDFGGSSLWEFGKQIKNKEVYIKITLGYFNKQTICISFHYPVRTIKYPFR